MRTLLFSTLIVIVGVGLGLGLAVARMKMTPWKPSRDESGPAAAPILPLSKGTPKVAVGRTEYDFGVVDRDTGASHAFVIENTGEAPLTLHAGETSNERITSSIDRESVPPGESAKVTVRWKPLTDADFSQQTAIVLTNDPQRPRVVLSVSGAIRVVLQSSPNELKFDRVMLGQPATAEMRVSCSVDEPLKIVGHEWAFPETADYFEVASEPL
jgi:hypothetical protein